MKNLRKKIREQRQRKREFDGARVKPAVDVKAQKTKAKRKTEKPEIETDQNDERKLKEKRFEEE